MNLVDMYMNTGIGWWNVELLYGMYAIILSYSMGCMPLIKICICIPGTASSHKNACRYHWYCICVRLVDKYMNTHLVWWHVELLYRMYTELHPKLGIEWMAFLGTQKYQKFIVSCSC
jgi:hypothetical protein